MHPILRTVLFRLFLGLVTLVLVSVVIFVSIQFLPGDFAQAVLGQSATDETVQALRSELGLDQPPVLRYFDWIGGLLQGDLGNSFTGRNAGGNDLSRPVAELIGPRFANTLFLAAVTAAIAVPLALSLGIAAALTRNSLFDRGVNIFTLINISFPEFFLAYILILLLGVIWPIFPTLADVSAGMEIGERLYRTALPAMTLTLVIIAHMMRMTRATIINLMGSPYIEMARLNGERPLWVVLRHALPNAWAPIAAVIAFNLAYLIVGVVVVEVVFVYPGIGQLMVDAVSARDIPVVQACALIFAATYVLFNLLADVVGIVTNPRLLHPR